MTFAEQFKHLKVFDIIFFNVFFCFKMPLKLNILWVSLRDYINTKIVVMIKFNAKFAI